MLLFGNTTKMREYPKAYLNVWNRNIEYSTQQCQPNNANHVMRFLIFQNLCILLVGSTTIRDVVQPLTKTDNLRKGDKVWVQYNIMKNPYI